MPAIQVDMQHVSKSESITLLEAKAERLAEELAREAEHNAEEAIFTTLTVVDALRCGDTDLRTAHGSCHHRSHGRRRTLGGDRRRLGRPHT